MMELSTAKLRANLQCEYRMGIDLLTRVQGLGLVTRLEVHSWRGAPADPRGFCF